MVTYRVYAIRLNTIRGYYVGDTAKPLATRLLEHQDKAVGTKGQRLSSRPCRRYGARCISRKWTPTTAYTTRGQAQRAAKAQAAAMRKLLGEKWVVFES